MTGVAVGEGVGVTVGNCGAICGCGVNESAVALGYVSGADFDRWVDPSQMLGPNVVNHS